MADQFMTLLEQKRPAIETILGGDADHKGRFIALAINAIIKEPKFNACAAESKVQCVLDAATCELELGTPDRLAWLVPYKNVLQFQPSYVGICKRLVEAGAAAKIRGELVYEHDTLEVRSGTEEKLIHRIGPINQRGGLVGAYAIAVLGNGMSTFEILELADIAAIERAALRIAGGTPSPAWREFRGEMIKKSAIRRLGKRLPGDRSKQTQAARLQAAMALDNRQFDFETTGVRIAGETTLDQVVDNIAEPGGKPPEPPKEPVYLTEDEQKLVEELIVTNGWRAREIGAVLTQLAGVESPDLIKQDDLRKVIAAIEKASTERNKETQKNGA